MIISRLLGSFCLICFCVGDKRLLIDQLRWDFLELENELWNLSSNGLLYMTREEVEPYLCEKFQDFDKKLMQMPQDLYGSETMRWIPKFSSFQSELKKIETLYQSFRDYQQHVMAESSDGASLEDNIYDIRNNKSGVENSDKKSLEDNIYDIKNNKSGAQNSDKKSLEDNIYDIKNNKSGAENSDKASLEDNIYDIKNNKSGAENSDKASLEDNIYDIKNNKSGAENSDRASLEDNIYDIKNNKSGAEKTVGREYENAYEDYNETLYRKFEDYQQQEMTGSSDIVRLEDIIYDITNNENGAEKTADRVYEIAYKDSDGIQEKLNEQNIDFDCRREQQSPQQPFYNLYNLFAFTDLKAYILQQFSHLVNRLQNKGDFVDKSIASRKKYESRISEAMNRLVLTVPARLERELWRCDPEVFVEGENYDQFTRLLQGHIQNEVDMSSERTCTRTCGEYSQTKNYGCYEDDTDYCKTQERCHGSIRDCFYQESRGSICGSPRGSRRYDFIRYKSGKTFGDAKGRSCPNNIPFKWWLRGFVDCDYCMCLCDEEGHLSDRYIFVGPVLADIKNNSVVTGVRLIKKNRILHLQIQEGKLLPYGYINQSTVHWVDVDNHKFDDADVFTMRYGRRSMALDNIQGDENHIVTGVHFEFVHDKIHLKLHVSPFDWHTGRVDHNKGYYRYTNQERRSKINIDNLDIPTNSYREIGKWYHQQMYSYVEFTHSSFEKDAAQSTVPFIDIQEVANKPAVPLSSAGIYHKGRSGYGGFIAPRIWTYNFANHLSSKLPNMGDRHDDADEEDMELLIVKLK